MRIVKESIIYSGANTPMLSSCAFPGICQLKNGTILASFKGAETKGPYNKTDRAITCISKDNGETWSEPERLQVETFLDMPLPLTGAPFITNDGRIGIQFEVNKPYYETKYWVHHSAAVYSSDGGYTWGDEVVITDSPSVYYWDQRIDALGDGTITDIFWTFDREKGDYINIHYCQSTDGGRSFAPLPDTGLVGSAGKCDRHKRR